VSKKIALNTRELLGFKLSKHSSSGAKIGKLGKTESLTADCKTGKISETLMGAKIGKV